MFSQADEKSHAYDSPIWLW